MANGSKPLKRNGRHEETRTPDLYRVNFEVNHLKPFPHLAFPLLPCCKIARKRPSFDGELMASCKTLRDPFSKFPHKLFTRAQAEYTPCSNIEARLRAERKSCRGRDDHH